MSFILEAKHLSVNYGKTPVLWDICLQIPEARLVGIIGPNGAGKSTFLKAALGIVKPLSGKIEFTKSPKIAYVPQKDSVDWDFPISVFDVVIMGRYTNLSYFKRIKKADKEAAYLALEQVGLLSLAKRQINELSGGQKQRLFIARALIQDADVYFLDEPFAGVDVTSEKVIFDLLLQLKNKGKTIFVVHHDLTSIESYFDYLILLNLRLIASGPLMEVFNSDNLSKTFGKHQALFDEVTRLSSKKSVGNK